MSNIDETSQKRVKWHEKYLFLCCIITWLCPLGPLVAYGVARWIMGMSAFDQVINLGKFRDVVDPLIYPAIILGLAAPLIGIITGGIAFIFTKKYRWIVFFPWLVSLGCLFLYVFVFLG